VDVDGVFDDPGVDASAGHGGGGHPAEDPAGGDGDVPVEREIGPGERVPGGGGGLEATSRSDVTSEKRKVGGSTPPLPTSRD
jgi:hypothetical protein